MFVSPTPPKFLIISNLIIRHVHISPLFFVTFFLLPLYYSIDPFLLSVLPQIYKTFLSPFMVLFCHTKLLSYYDTRQTKTIIIYNYNKNKFGFVSSRIQTQQALAVSRVGMLKSILLLTIASVVTKVNRPVRTRNL